MSAYKLVVVRDDGKVQVTEFKGYHGETAAYRYFTEANNDPRTMYAAVLEGQDEDNPVWYPRSEKCTFFLRRQKTADVKP